MNMQNSIGKPRVKRNKHLPWLTILGLNMTDNKNKIYLKQQGNFILVLTLLTTFRIIN